MFVPEPRLNNAYHRDKTMAPNGRRPKTNNRERVWEIDRMAAIDWGSVFSHFFQQAQSVLMVVLISSVYSGDGTLIEYRLAS